MGCCASRPTATCTATSPPAAAAGKPKKKAPLLGDDDGDRLVWEPRFVGDLCHLGVSACSYPASSHDAAQHVVKYGDGFLFAAMFVGQFGGHAAALCRARANDVFMEEWGGKGGEGVPPALTRTFRRLDSEFLMDDAVPQEVRAGSGASGLILVVDYDASKAYCASLGTARCLVSTAVGSFVCGGAEGEFVTAEHTLRNDLERRRLQKAAASDDVFVNLPGGEPTLKGITNLTRGIGFGCLKTKSLAGVYRERNPLGRGGPTGRVLMTAEPLVVSYPLNSQVEHVALCAEGLAGLLSRHDLALALHFFGRYGRRQDEARALAAIDGLHLPTSTPARVVHDDEGAVDGVEGGRNAAEHLLLRALARAGDNAAARLGRGMVPLEELQRMPRAGATSLAEAEQLRNASPGGGGLLDRLPRLALHGDLAAVVVSLQWPVSLGPVQRGFNAAAVARAVDPQTRDVDRRWALLRMAADCQRAKRRVLLKAWWDLVGAAMKDGRTRARAIEQKLYVERNMTVQVSPAGKVRDLHTGQVYDYQALLDGSMWTPGEERSAEGQGHGPSPLQGRAAGESRGGGHLRGSSGQDGGGGGHNGVCGQNGCGQQQGFEADGIGDDDGSLQKHEVGVGGAGGVQTPAERRATAP